MCTPQERFWKKPLGNLILPRLENWKSYCKTYSDILQQTPQLFSLKYTVTEKSDYVKYHMFDVIVH